MTDSFYPIPNLRSARLLLNAFEDTDSSAVASLADDPEVNQWIPTLPHPFTTDAARDWILAHTPAAASGSSITWAIRLLAATSLAGSLTLRRMPDDPATAEMGFWLGKPYRSRGIASEAIQTAIPFCATKAGIKLLHAHCLGNNHASARVLLKNGFRPTGCRPYDSPANGHPLFVRTFELNIRHNL